MFASPSEKMTRLEQIYKLVQECNISVSDIFTKYMLTPKKRYEIIAQMEQEDPDECWDPRDLDQMCDTPTSQKKILSFF